MNKINALTLAAVLSLLSAQAAYATSSADTGPGGAVVAPAPVEPHPNEMSGTPGAPPPSDRSHGGPGDRFGNADLNKDGFLTKAEMMDVQQKRMDKMFSESDTDGDGKLSQAELQAGFKAMREKMRARFDKLQQLNGGKPIAPEQLQ